MGGSGLMSHVVSTPISNQVASTTASSYRISACIKVTQIEAPCASSGGGGILSQTLVRKIENCASTKYTVDSSGGQGQGRK